MRERVVIGVGKNRTVDWDRRFLEALDRLRLPCAIESRLIDFSAHDWHETAAACDAVVWRTDFLGPRAVADVRAQLAMLEFIDRKVVVPNASTYWHFDNKMAQAWLLRSAGVPTPETFASFDYHDALAALERQSFPLVFKEPYGAGSRYVRLVRDRDGARRILESRFAVQLFKETRARHRTRLSFFLSNAHRRWFRHLIWSRLTGSVGERWQWARPAVYWQSYVPGNDADLRIAVVGDRIALGFWRKNRPNDFRASGSGRIDYERPIPPEAARYCIRLSAELGFDSMAYDILFDGDRFVITELSYAYVDRLIQASPGRFELDPDGTLRFVEGHWWPQELWIEWLGRRIEREILSPDPARLPS